MEANEKFQPGRKKSPRRFSTLFDTEGESVAVYTVLNILVHMKDQMGLEAMLEYIEKYLQIIDRYNPKLKRAVAKALSLMSVEKMYKDMVKQ